eukprot:TRINITY_DN121770_c0_g1_i1.p1 TRINITY_DN121770_c0_g1~~TRINITY_DN121770_c0_g1_i1.p1  ORF type:complete len:457 (-),score=84.33 TRINITY_DN121770_c0_g1_i1:2-1372(-)
MLGQRWGIALGDHLPWELSTVPSSSGGLLLETHAGGLETFGGSASSRATASSSRAAAVADVGGLGAPRRRPSSFKADDHKPRSPEPVAWKKEKPFLAGVAALRGVGARPLEDVRWTRDGKQLGQPELSPTPEFCAPGRTDYGAPCPQGWTPGVDPRTGARSMCVSPRSWLAPPGCSNQIQALGMSTKAKELFETDCRVKWPCRDESSESLAADVDAAWLPEQGAADIVGESTDYSVACPEGWGYFTDGSCRAPASYRGACLRKMHFLGWTGSMKAAWSRLCDVRWPAMEVKEPSEYEMEMRRRAEKYRYCEWAGGCTKDYTGACPMGWRALQGGWCRAPTGVAASGPAQQLLFQPDTTSQCPDVVNMSRFSDRMKAAFERHCGVSWPCMRSPEEVAKLADEEAVRAVEQGLPPPSVLALCLQFAEQRAAGCRNSSVRRVRAEMRQRVKPDLLSGFL